MKIYYVTNGKQNANLTIYHLAAGEVGFSKLKSYKFKSEENFHCLPLCQNSHYDGFMVFIVLYYIQKVNYSQNCRWETYSPWSTVYSTRTSIVHQFYQTNSSVGVGLKRNWFWFSTAETARAHLPVGAHSFGRVPAVSQRALPAGGVRHAGILVITLPRAHLEPQNAVLCEDSPCPAHLGGDWTMWLRIESAYITSLHHLIHLCLTSLGCLPNKLCAVGRPHEM